MILDTTSKVLEIILGGAKTTNDCEFTADYVDTQSGTTFAPAGTIGLSNGATLVTAVAAPAASTQRAVRAFTFYNADTVNTAVTVRIFDGTNRRRIIVMTLTPGQSLVFTPEAGWAVLPSTNGQIPGTVTNDNATAGNDGEFVETDVPTGSAVAVTNGNTFNLGSVNLSAGDWDVSASIMTLPGTGTITTALIGSLSTTSGTLDSVERRQYLGGGISSAANANLAIPLPRRRYSFAASTLVYAVANISFSVSTMSIAGFINARRAR